MKKWFIAFIGVLVHLFLGTVYAWSYFQTPIVEFTGWSHTQTTWAFSLSIFMLGVSAAWGGINLPKYGSRKLVIIGGSLYAIGYLLAGVALHYQSLWILYLGFGFVGGTGLGLAYVTPVATVSTWFTKHQGLATGMVVMGFGFGALVMSKILAPYFMSISHSNLSKSFLYIGLLLLILLPGFAWFLKPSPKKNLQKKNTHTTSAIQHILAKPFFILWCIFLINITAGMVFIAFQSPLLQDLLLKTLTTTDLSSSEVNIYLTTSGATLIGVSSIFNGAGRFTWAALSDKIGRITTFKILLFTQILVFVGLIFVQNPILFSFLVCIILLCYGGGFGLMPSLIKDSYGTELMASLYGSILTAWSIGGILGPQLVAYMKDNHTENAGFLVYLLSGGMLLLGFGLSFLYKAEK
ncbi:MAG TPA: OFA family MFS transporter [Flavobacteriaceae bacterium]|nr:OFA family MFS transporter [Flavobacteriaceae bacterium]